MTADERKTLLVAGAAAGMAATFNAPLASVLLAVELLLFEWRPRSFVPVVAAVVTSTLLRGPPARARPAVRDAADAPAPHRAATSCCAFPPARSAVCWRSPPPAWSTRRRTRSRGCRIHWMWWPAIGGLIIGIGGLIEPRALGVGYDVIDQLLTGRAGISLIIGILVVKTLIWGLSLGSGTSGGVLAPVFMIGGALGALEGHLLPGGHPGFWALVGLAAVVGGVMRSPLTGVVFPLELTHAWPLLLPLLIAATAAYTVSALLLKRSVLTEKIARRGLHLSPRVRGRPARGAARRRGDAQTPMIADGRGIAGRAERAGRPAAPMAVPGGRGARAARASSLAASSSISTAAAACSAGDVALPPALTASRTRRCASSHAASPVSTSPPPWCSRAPIRPRSWV